MTADVRWFSPNRFGTLVVPGLRASGFSVATEGDEPARLAVAIDGQLGEAAFRFARRHRCPLVLYLWDLPPWRLGSGRADPVFAIGAWLVRIPRPLGGYSERAGFYSRLGYLARRAAALWVPSHATAADVRARYGVAAEVVPYCYDSARFTPGEWRRGTGWRLCSVSRLVAHKNQAAVIRAAARLDPSTVVQLIGQGPDAGHLRALANRLHVELLLDDRWQSDDAVLAAYRRATVVVAPSRFEGFGLTPIEALAVGTPVVASDIAAHREFLGPEVGTFPLDDDQALVEAIRAAAARGPVKSAVLDHLSIDAAVGRLGARIGSLLETVVR